MNKMRDVKIEKVILNIGGTAENLDKGFKLLERLTKKKPMKRKSSRRIPSLGVRPKMEVGCMVTLRKGYEDLLRRLFESIDNRMKRKSVVDNHLSFGIKEYIEIQGIEYQRDIGIIGFDVTITFVRTGRRVAQRKIKRAHIPKSQRVPKEEIIKFMEDNFRVEFV